MNVWQKISKHNFSSIPWNIFRFKRSYNHFQLFQKLQLLSKKKIQNLLFLLQSPCCIDFTFDSIRTYFICDVFVLFNSCNSFNDPEITFSFLPRHRIATYNTYWIKAMISYSTHRSFVRFLACWFFFLAFSLSLFSHAFGIFPFANKMNWNFVSSQ